MMRSSPGMAVLKRRRSSRRAVVMILVITVLAVCALLGSATLKTVAVHSREVRRAEDESRTRLLAEAGLQRAARRHAADQSYTGEKWRLTAAELNADGDAVIEIAIATTAGGRSITAAARYPENAKHPVVTTRSLNLPVSN